MPWSGSRMVGSFAVLIASGAAWLAFGTSVHAAPTEQFTPIAAEVVATPNPVLASDGRRHLAYELLLTNRTRSTATIERIDAFGGGRRLKSMTGQRLAGVGIRFGHDEPGVEFNPGETGFVLMDVTLPRKARIPARLSHRLTVSLDPANAVNAGKYTAAPVKVSKRAAPVVAPPLRGPGWVIGNGCCANLTSHRAALLSIDGKLQLSERFAIDFFQINPEGSLADGPMNELPSFPFFGAKVYSATRGKVVDVARGLPETAPGFDLPPSTAAKSGGNVVVVSIGGGRYALYAHLKTNSARVKVGDRVRPGQVLGLLGNTGNSNFPHLHFQLMDAAAPLAANGLPYRFRDFRVQGTLQNFIGTFLGEEAVITPEPSGTRKARLPLNNQVIDFG